MQYRGETGGMEKGEMVAAGTPQIPQKWSFIHHWGFSAPRKWGTPREVQLQGAIHGPTYYLWRRSPLLKFDLTDEKSNLLSMSCEKF